MELCFRFKVESGTVLLVTTDWLSQNTLAGLSNGIPNIRSLYHNASIISTAILMATNSEPKVDVS